MLEIILFIIGAVILFFGIVYCISAVFAELNRERNASEADRALTRSAIKTGFVIAVVLVIPLVFVTVDAGNVGIQNTFGVVDDKVLQPGLSIKNPFTEVIPMSTRTMKYLDYGTSDVATIKALSNDGLETTMGIAVTYHVNPIKITELYKNVGTDYSGVIMVNPIHSVPRDMISKYDTKTLYSASQEGSVDREKLEQELFTKIQKRTDETGVPESIIIEQVSIRIIDFDAVYKSSISSKMKMDTEIAERDCRKETRSPETGNGSETCRCRSRRYS